VTELCGALDCSLVDFFRELKHVLARRGPQLRGIVGLEGKRGGSLEQQLQVRELAGELSWVSVLFKKYQEKFRQLFTPAEGRDGAEDPWFRFGWLLFILAKDRLVPRFPDLISCTYLLACTLNVLLAHIEPSRLWNPLKNAEAYPAQTEAGATDTLACIARLFQCSPDQAGDVAELMPQVDELLAGVLASDESVERCEPPPDSLIAFGCHCYKGLLTPGAAERHIAVLDEAYEAAYRDHREIDERMIADPLPAGGGNSIGNLGKMTPALKKHTPAGGAPAQQAAAIFGGAGAVPSPFRHAGGDTSPRAGALGVRTPVSEAMRTTQWVRETTAPYLALAEAAEFSGAPEALTELLVGEGGGDPQRAALAGRIHHFVLDQAEKIIPAPGSGGTQAGKRRREGVALYYATLHCMLASEQVRKGGPVAARDLSGILKNKQLHVALVAFAFELIAAAYKIVSITFPTVLERLDICTFDLSKVIEPLVRPGTGINLPKDLLRHLSAIEERSLELLAWKPGSSLYKYLAEARGVGAQQQREGAGVAGGPASAKSVTASLGKNSAFQTYVHLPPAYGSPGKGGTSAEAVLEEFFKKLLRLAAIRLLELCERLDRARSFFDRSADETERKSCSIVVRQTYAIAEHIVYKQTRLLYNRHFDQILLAIVYGVCKVNRLQVQFREIVNHYTKQPQCTQEVYRAIVLQQHVPETGDGEWEVLDRGDVIAFYNKVFIPLMKEELFTVAKTAPPEEVGAPEGHAGAPAGPGSGEPVGLRTPSKKRPADVALEGQGRDGPAGKGAFPPVYTRSPQKVAANVYMSPMRQSQEYWMSQPQENSMYAFVGEATHAYQSPSKSLQHINSRLQKDGSAGFTAAAALDAAKSAAASMSAGGQAAAGRSDANKGPAGSSQ
jgi:retinoblastoma-like protein 1